MFVTSSSKLWTSVSLSLESHLKEGLSNCTFAFGAGISADAAVLVLAPLGSGVRGPRIACTAALAASIAAFFMSSDILAGILEFAYLHLTMWMDFFVTSDAFCMLDLQVP